jgi:hypothetical protein
VEAMDERINLKKCSVGEIWEERNESNIGSGIKESVNGSLGVVGVHGFHSTSALFLLILVVESCTFFQELI